MRVRVAGIAALAGTGILVAGLTLTQASAAPPPDPENSKKKVDAQVDRLETDLEGSSRRLLAAQADYDAAQTKLVPARAAAATARTRLAQARASDAAMRARLAVAVRAERRAERDLRQVDTDIAEDRKTAGLLARAAYAQGPFAQFGPIMQAESPTEFAQRMAMMQSVMRSQNAALDRLSDVRGETTRRETALADRRTRAARERQAAAAVLARTAAAERVAAAAEDRVEALLDDRRDAVATIEAERADDLARYRAMLAEQRRLAELIKRLEAEPGTGPVVGSGKGTLARPVNGPVTSGFGPRFHPILKYNKLHTGTDFKASTGTPVRAAGAGKVITVGRTAAYGNRVIVSHGSVNGKSLVTTYNHLSATSVRSGQQVARGELVGKAGSTGYSTGPHLHFEVLVGGEFENPMRWL
jgi:murein DD-endopeptidase MepM/ murein hydrolase activator NlpD